MNWVQYARDGRDNNFHLIRHLAALAVVFTHSYSVVTGQYTSEPLVNLLGRSIGHYAVDVFFVLSGFVVTQSLARNANLTRFAISRILRIFPALAVAVLATTFVLGPLVTTLEYKAYFADPQIWVYLIGAISTLDGNGSLPGVFETTPMAGLVNIPLWTLKYELWAYFVLSCLAALSLVGGRRAVTISIAGLIVIYIAGRILLPWPASELYVSNALHMSLTFFLGASGYLLRRHIPLTPLIALLIFGLAYSVKATLFYELVEKILIAYTMIWLAFLALPRSSNLSRYGDISYGIYIFAYPIQQTIYLMMPGVQPLELFVIALLAAVPMALLSWHFIEKPSLKLRDRFTLVLSRPIVTRRRRPQS